MLLCFLRFSANFLLTKSRLVYILRPHILLQLEIHPSCYIERPQSVLRFNTQSDVCRDYLVCPSFATALSMTFLQSCLAMRQSFNSSQCYFCTLKLNDCRLQASMSTFHMYALCELKYGASFFLPFGEKAVTRCIAETKTMKRIKSIVLEINKILYLPKWASFLLLAEIPDLQLPPGLGQLLHPDSECKGFCSFFAGRVWLELDPGIELTTRDYFVLQVWAVIYGAS